MIKRLVTITFYEWLKVWANKKFLLLLGSIFFINIGMLWYTNLPNDYTPDLSAYKQLNNEIKSLSDEEKIAFIEQYADELTEETEPKFSDQYMQEVVLINQILEELNTVSNYPQFLKNIQTQTSVLSDISIFQSSGGNSYSDKNIIRTSEDYKLMEITEPTYMDSKAISLTFDGIFTDILILLLICMAVYILAFYEKEKNLYCMIRSCVNGKLACVICKVFALLISCSLLVLLLYGSKLIYCFIRVPIPALSNPIQCLAPYVSTTLQISIGVYLILCMIGKILVLMLMGSILFLLSIWSRYVFLPYLISLGILFVGYSMWKMILPTSNLAILKYLSPFGMLDTNEVFGSYLNLSILNEPYNLRIVWGVFLVMALVMICSLVVISYTVHGYTLINEVHLVRRRYKLHNNLILHEMYKILIMNKGILIIGLFIAVTSYYYSNHSYYVSNNELIYRQYMKQLEGVLTEEKEAFLHNENFKFQEAMIQCEEIDLLYEAGEISYLQTATLKEPHEKILSKYPVFQEVWEKYEFVKEHPSAEFVYDLGYNRFFAISDDSSQISIILFLAALIFTISAVVPMEYSNQQYRILHPTLLGMKKIMQAKLIICSIISIVFILISIGCRHAHIINYYEMPNLGARAISIFGDGSIFAEVSLGSVIVISYLGLVLLGLGIMGLIICISKVIKNSIYTIIVFAIIVVSIFTMLPC